ncbi:MAG: transposase [Chloroflexi bacterium]|nr:transposase [Chloroflexota bacterium]
MKDSTFPALLQALFELLQAHRPVFRQERTFLRAIGLLIGEVFAFGRHTVTQGLLALGLTDADWSAWYRLFSRKRFDPDKASVCLLGQTLRHVPVKQPYVTGVDSVQVPRSSLKMPGTCWLKALGTAPFRPGLHRAQRFVDVSWLIPPEGGYSRAVPLCWLPAFPAKAVSAECPPRKEWEAGQEGIAWVRKQLDAAEREEQLLLVLVDGSFERVVEFWRGLPERAAVLGRCARNRVLYQLPHYSGRGRPPSYGERAPRPAQWLKVRSGWQTAEVRVRGKVRNLRYRVEGPYLREGLPDRPVFLIVVRGQDRRIGKRRIRRKPAFYLVSAVWKEGKWVLPLPAEALLAWAWQRWEQEVAHRELKCGLGLGEKQCWNQRSAIVSVQWSAWVYAVLVLAGYRTWGLCQGPTCPGRWWRGSRRWSLNTLWRGYRAAFWGHRDFRAVWMGTGDNWLKKGDWIAGLWNSVTAAARI